MKRLFECKYVVVFLFALAFTVETIRERAPLHPSKGRSRSSKQPSAPQGGELPSSFYSRSSRVSMSPAHYEKRGVGALSSLRRSRPSRNEPRSPTPSAGCA